MIIDTSFAPFIRDKVIINQSQFRNQLYQAMITSKRSHAIMGHNGGTNLQPILKSSIGEFIERHSLSVHYRMKDEPIPAFRLTTGEEIHIPAQKIFFIQDATFTDSCGTASHLNSKQAIQKAFLEFVERQSLIFNWLTASSGKRIDVEDISTEKGKKLYTLLSYFLDEIYLFEISLTPYVNVVLGFGVNKFLKSVGLAANLDIDETIEAALEEMIQGLSNCYNKDEIETIENDSKMRHQDLYTEIYYNMTPSRLLDSFSYLLEGESYYRNNGQQYEINALISQVEKSLGIPIYCTFIPVFYRGVRTKIVKVFSPEAYPHMYPPEFTEQETRLQFNKGISKFPNAYSQIPFP